MRTSGNYNLNNSSPVSRLVSFNKQTGRIQDQNLLKQIFSRFVSIFKPHYFELKVKESAERALVDYFQQKYGDSQKTAPELLRRTAANSESVHDKLFVAGKAINAETVGEAIRNSYFHQQSPRARTAPRRVAIYEEPSYSGLKASSRGQGSPKASKAERPAISFAKANLTEPAGSSLRPTKIASTPKSVAEQSPRTAEKVVTTPHFPQPTPKPDAAPLQILPPQPRSLLEPREIVEKAAALKESLQTTNAAFRPAIGLLNDFTSTAAVTVKNIKNQPFTKLSQRLIDAHTDLMVKLAAIGRNSQAKQAVSPLEQQQLGREFNLLLGQLTRLEGLANQFFNGARTLTKQQITKLQEFSLNSKLDENDQETIDYIKDWFSYNEFQEISTDQLRQDAVTIAEGLGRILDSIANKLKAKRHSTSNMPYGNKTATKADEPLITANKQAFLEDLNRNLDALLAYHAQEKVAELATPTSEEKQAEPQQTKPDGLTSSQEEKKVANPELPKAQKSTSLASKATQLKETITADQEKLTSLKKRVVNQSNLLANTKIIHKAATELDLDNRSLIAKEDGLASYKKQEQALAGRTKALNKAIKSNQEQLREIAEAKKASDLDDLEAVPFQFGEYEETLANSKEVIDKYNSTFIDEAQKVDRFYENLLARKQFIGIDQKVFDHFISVYGSSSDNFSAEEIIATTEALRTRIGIALAKLTVASDSL